MQLTLARSAEIVAQFDLTLEETQLCRACLSFVSAGLREGDERDARRWAQRMTEFIWEEGLDGCPDRDLARLGRAGLGCGRRSRPPRVLRFATPTASRCHQQREASVAAPQTHQLAPRSRRSHGINHLAAPAIDATRRAAKRGVAHADFCLADLESRGGRSVVARAIVLRLAAELAEEEQRWAELHLRARTLLGGAPPQWN